MTDNSLNTSDNLIQHAEEQQHIKAGQYVKSAVYGGLDGLITTLNIALSGIGTSAGAGVIVALGLASLIADGVSMGVADYLATKSDDQYMKAEEQRERNQMQMDFEAEKQQMIHIYENMGIKDKEAKEIVDILSENKEGFLKVMMIQELHLIADEQNPFRNSLVTFFSFCIFGLMPLIPFIVAKTNNIQLDQNFTISAIVISFVFLFVLGFGKSFVTSAKWYYSALETILIGAISAGASFGIGTLFGS